ncbi:MAG: ParB/RepB/Spo0J family partition protein [Armatimonadetes bacterium]|nr:ParB/RepB/Spo0J family partition protein [Armatimonadota bacterium]
MRRALGKGLIQLMGEESEAAPAAIAIDAIRPNSQQPRRRFGEEGLAELAQSIREVGVLLPLIVRPVSDGLYELIAGERRLRAAKLAGLAEIPVIVRSASAQASLEIALIENLQREDISAVECAHAYRQLADKFGLSQERIAQKVGKSRAAVANTLRILKLPEEMQQAISDGSITEGHARALLMAEGAVRRQVLFDRIVRDGLSVREAERIARGDDHPSAVTVGDAPTNGKPARTSRFKDPNSRALEAGLSEFFGTPVRLEPGEIGGKMIVEYYSDEDLQRILDVIGVRI